MCFDHEITSTHSEIDWLYLLVVVYTSEPNQVMVFKELIVCFVLETYETHRVRSFCCLNRVIVTTGLYMVEGNEILICELYGSMQGRMQACGGP
jgi:hypothetical protein